MTSLLLDLFPGHSLCAYRESESDQVGMTVSLLINHILCSLFSLDFVIVHCASQVYTGQSCAPALVAAMMVICMYTRMLDSGCYPPGFAGAYCIRTLVLLFGDYMM